MSTTDTHLELTYLSLDQLGPHPDNIRKNLGDLADLTKSIDGTGILEPLLVLPANDEGVHLVVAGHRRLAAALKATSVTDAPCVIRDLDPAEVVEAMLVENLQRAEISPVEEAQGYARLVELGTTVTTIAKKVGRSAAHVKGRLALTTLPAPLLRLIEDGVLTLAKAADIAAHADDADAMEWITDDLAGMKAHEWEWFNPGTRLARYIGDRNENDALDAEAAKLDKAGLTRFDPPRGWWMPSHLDLARPCKVEHLELDKDDRRAHAKEPCHQVLLEIKDRTAPELKVTRTPMCMEPRRHTTTAADADRSALQIPTHDLAGDADDPGADPMPGANLGGGTGAAERAVEFAAAEQLAQARSDAADARAAFTRTYATSTPTGMPEFFAASLLEDIEQFSDYWGLAATAGCAEDDDMTAEIWRAAIDGTAEERDPWLWAWAFNEAEGTSTWRMDRIADGVRGPSRFVAYLRFLSSVGYELSDYEAEVIAEYEAAVAAAEVPDVDDMELSDDITEILTLWGGWLAKSADPSDWAAGADTVPDHILEDLKLRGLAEFVPPSGPLGVGTVKPTAQGRAVATVLAKRQEATAT